jgi:regulator of sigma E protease
MGILLFFVVLFVLILVHEWGHFIVAKKTGMRVDEFGIGFPPKLFGIKKGETEYTFNALPIGGFVRIWGENYDEARPDESVDNTRSFSARPKWAQALVLVAGVTMNVLFAWFLFTVTYLVGVATPVDEATATPAAELYVTNVIADSPAAVLPVGAIITEVAYGEEVVTKPTPAVFTETIQRAGAVPVTISYREKDEDKSVVLTPRQAVIIDHPDRYAVGASLALVEIKQYGLVAAITEGFRATWEGLVSISVGLWTLLSQAFMGEADFSQVAGPVGIVGMVGDAASYGITALLIFTAIISLNLAVINLLPFPALDGGRLVFVVIEAVTKKRIPPEWAGRMNLVGFALLMLLMIVVTYNDIVRLL